MEKSEYIERLKLAVQHMHGCAAEYSRSVPVHEVFKGQTVWKGVVEVFNLSGHPKAKTCYAWSHLDGNNDEEERFVAVLAVGPINSPKTAVMASIASQ